MPPFDDDVSMKLNLLSWAYAVPSHALSNKTTHAGLND